MSVKVVIYCSALLCAVLNGHSALSAEGISFDNARPKINSIIVDSFKPFRDALYVVIEESVVGELPQGTEISKHLRNAGYSEVKFEDSPGLTSFSYAFEFTDGFNVYLSVDTSDKEPLYSASLSKFGKPIGNCNFEYTKKHRFKEGSCDVYDSQFVREKTVFYDDQLEILKIDHYLDPPIGDLSKIYGPDFLAPNLDVKVAVIDSGVDYNHPSIAKNLPRTLNAEGQLQIAGWDFIDQDNKAFDLAEDVLANHGTGVAGLIVQVDPNVEIIPVRMPSSDQLYETIAYAHNAGAQIMNLSFEISGYSDDDLKTRVEESLARAMREFSDVLFVVAAGNKGIDLDKTRLVPQTLGISNMIVVGSVDRSGELTSNPEWGSNFSRSIVHLAALGNNIQIAIPGNGFEMSGGTSFAAPQVAGVLAKIKREAKKASPEDLIQKLKEQIVVLDSLRDVTIYSGIPKALISLLEPRP